MKAGKREQCASLSFGSSLPLSLSLFRFTGITRDNVNRQADSEAEQVTEQEDTKKRGEEEREKAAGETETETEGRKQDPSFNPRIPSRL